MQAPPSVKKNNGGKNLNIFLLDGKRKGECSWGWGRRLPRLSPSSLKEEIVYLLSPTEHLHVKKAQFLCGQDLSGPRFLRDRAECRVRTPGKG